MALEHLTKQTFLDKVFNFEANEEWKYEGDAHHFPGTLHLGAEHGVDTGQFVEWQEHFFYGDMLELALLIPEILESSSLPSLLPRSLRLAGRLPSRQKVPVRLALGFASRI